MEPTNIESGAFFVGVLTGAFISMFGLICGWYLGAKCSDHDEGHSTVIRKEQT